MGDDEIVPIKRIKKRLKAPLFLERKPFMRKQGILIILTTLSLLLTGCWSRVEVNDIAIVTAVAIDKLSDGNIRIALQVPIPMRLGPIGASGGGGGGGNEMTLLVSEAGETVLDAYRRLQKKVSRRIFFSQNRVLIIGEKAARDGVFPILDYFSRGRGARLRGLILFSKGEAAPLLKLTPKLERYNAEVIREEENERVGLRIMQKDFIDMLTTEGISPVAARVEERPEEIKGEQYSLRNMPSDKERLTPAIVGAAVFHQDKLVGWMNDEETRGILWLRNELKTAIITVNIPKEKGGGKISAMLIREKTKVKPILMGNKVKMEVNIHAENEIHENGSKLDLGDPKVLEYVQTLLEKDVKERIQLALHKAQKQLNCDIFGFGNAVYRTYPKVWKKQFKNRWDDVFPNLEVKINPHVTVVRTGLSSKTPEMRD
ncbi:Ger(x)C family spore germination protein [Paenibacillus sp. LMG 31458]|uniref:Ger(X)C family spore germination protein n=1 Tax=Paenibacillus phytorum TaxID=2654977 RepID=A0ABX1Y756_9BACL|nr:Ger(x)C family spore germination protein [Paenibacillus phytorum]NOU76702.1 Ger(x)C family spore germination protein [Paenibacillus phytorum]